MKKIHDHDKERGDPREISTYLITSSNSKGINYSNNKGNYFLVIFN